MAGIAPFTSLMGRCHALVRIQSDASSGKPKYVNEDLSGLDAPKHRRLYSSSWPVSAPSLQPGEVV